MQSYRLPPPLSKGTRIALTSISRHVMPRQIQAAETLLKARGYEVIRGEGIGRRDRCFAGTIFERVNDLNSLLMNANIDVIWLARGGYGAMEVLDSLPIQSPPLKWIVGYSDVTALHAEVQYRWGWVTLHATMPVLLEKGCPAELASMEAALRVMQHQWEPILWPVTPPMRVGVAEGVLVGGNVSVLTSLLGSRTDFSTRGKILVLEDVDEMVYHLDRLMLTLRRAGKLNGLAALVVGGLTRMQDSEEPFAMERSAYEIVMERLPDDAQYPVVQGAPFGHFPGQKPLLLGVPARLEVTNQTACLTYLLP